MNMKEEDKIVRLPFRELKLWQQLEAQNEGIDKCVPRQVIKILEHMSENRRVYCKTL